MFNILRITGHINLGGNLLTFFNQGTDYQLLKYLTCTSKNNYCKLLDKQCKLSYFCSADSVRNIKDFNFVFFFTPSTESATFK
jgi:hypothetical protein